MEVEPNPKPLGAVVACWRDPKGLERVEDGMVDEVPNCPEVEPKLEDGVPDTPNAPPTPGAEAVPNAPVVPGVVVAPNAPPGVWTLPKTLVAPVPGAVVVLNGLDVPKAPVVGGAVPNADVPKALEVVVDPKAEGLVVGALPKTL